MVVARVNGKLQAWCCIDESAVLLRVKKNEADGLESHIYERGSTADAILFGIQRES